MHILSDFEINLSSKILFRFSFKLVSSDQVNKFIKK